VGMRSIDFNAIAWTEVTDTWQGKVAAGEPDVRYKPFETGSGAVPRGQFVEYEPGHFEKAHSHEESELLYILDGDATFGDDRVGPGMLLYIEGGTTYGPITGGSNGLRFLRLHLVED
jgi:mannose-6-phosphate isomerase-like protein (cupin superfamily)